MLAGSKCAQGGQASETGPVKCTRVAKCENTTEGNESDDNDIFGSFQKTV